MGRIFRMAVIIGVLGLARAGSAQVSPYDPAPYDDHPACRFIDFLVDKTTGMQVAGPHVSCSTPTGAGVARMNPTIYSFAEGAMHVPGSEYAWVILANFRDVPVRVTIAALITGGGTLYQEVEVPAQTRTDFSLHSHPTMQLATTFSIRVYWPGDGDAQLVMRPAQDMWSRAILPPATVLKP